MLAKSVLEVARYSQRHRDLGQPSPYTSGHHCIRVHAPSIVQCLPAIVVVGHHLVAVAVPVDGLADELAQRAEHDVALLYAHQLCSVGRFKVDPRPGDVIEARVGEEAFRGVRWI